MGGKNKKKNGKNNSREREREFVRAFFCLVGWFLLGVHNDNDNTKLVQF